MSQTAYKFTYVDIPGAYNTYTWGINSPGEIVGFYFDATDPHGFIYSNGVSTNIDIPNAQNVEAFGINAMGAIVGTYTDSTGGHAFLDDGGSTSIIDRPQSILYNPI
jgi:hypothetical protein